MTKTIEQIREENRSEIQKFQEMIELTKKIIELTFNRDKYGQPNYLSNFTEELDNHIQTYEFSIKERLFSLYKNKDKDGKEIY